MTEVEISSGPPSGAKLIVSYIRPRHHPGGSVGRNNPARGRRVPGRRIGLGVGTGRRSVSVSGRDGCLVRPSMGGGVGMGRSVGIDTTQEIYTRQRSHELGLHTLLSAVHDTAGGRTGSVGRPLPGPRFPAGQARMGSVGRPDPGRDRARACGRVGRSGTYS
jgi:hypothetical protein